MEPVEGNRRQRNGNLYELCPLCSLHTTRTLLSERMWYMHIGENYRNLRDDETVTIPFSQGTYLSTISNAEVKHACGIISILVECLTLMASGRVKPCLRTRKIRSMHNITVCSVRVTHTIYIYIYKYIEKSASSHD